MHMRHWVPRSANIMQAPRSSCSAVQRKRPAGTLEDGAAGLVALPYPSLDPAFFDISVQHTTSIVADQQESAQTTTASEQHQVADDELLFSSTDDVPTDSEASIMLLCSQLYPDPAAAAAAAAAAKQSRSAKRSKNAPGSSKATVAAVAAAAAAATAAKQLPHIILKSQLYTVLADRTAVDRELEELKLRGKAKLFKLCIGADEYVVMLIADYFSIVDGLITNHQVLAQQLQVLEQQNQQQQAAQAAASTGAADSITNSSTEHAALAATLQLFRSRVAPVHRESHITRIQLIKLMQTAPAEAAAAGAANRPAATPAAAARKAAAAKDAEAMQRHLLSAELICRDRRVQDSYMFTVPGAAAFVKSVVAGRQELLQMLQRKKYQEVLEKDFMCIKLRSSCLTPAFHLKDIQGRNLVSCIETTAGKLVRLVKRK